MAESTRVQNARLRFLPFPAIKRRVRRGAEGRGGVFRRSSRVHKNSLGTFNLTDSCVLSMLVFSAQRVRKSLFLLKVFLNTGAREHRVFIHVLLCDLRASVFNPFRLKSCPRTTTIIDALVPRTSRTTNGSLQRTSLALDNP